jgi:WXG100 family type VII secretion target
VNGFRADLAALEDLVARLGAFDQRAANLTDRLEADARRLHGQWSGPAADAHATAHRRWQLAHEQVRVALEQLAGFARGAHTNYLSAAASNLRMWS